MALPSSGAIRMGADVNVELELSATTQISLGQLTVRTLYGISSGPIRLAADGYGKSSFTFNGIQQGSKLVGTPWTYPSSTIPGPQQGAAVAISDDGNTMVTTARGDNFLGGAFVFTRSGTTWSQQAKLVPSGISSTKLSAGYSVALSNDGNTCVVGAPFGNSNQNYCIITFTRSGTTWSQQSVITNNAFASFGWAVSLSADGNTLAVGSYQHNSFAGTLHIYTRSGSTWSLQAGPLNPPVAYSNFGYSIKLSANGNTCAVGSRYDDSLVGAGHIFVRSGTTWSYEAKLQGTGYVGSPQMGEDIAISSDGNTVALGGNADNAVKGAVWIFSRSGTTWSQVGTKLVSTGGTGSFQGLGSALSLSGDGKFLVAGGNYDNYVGSFAVGAIWFFKNVNGSWSQYGSKFLPNDYIGGRVALGETKTVAVARNTGTVVGGGPGDTVLTGTNFTATVGATWIIV